MALEDDLGALGASPLLDAAWYLARHPDVAASGMGAAEHFLRVGARIGRDPGPLFSTEGYLGLHRDVARSGQNPLLHYERFGRAEGRRSLPSAQATAPEEARADVVVPVHDALADVEACLRSLAAARVAPRVRILVVDDGSSEATGAWLRWAVGALGTKRTTFTLIEHAANRGYTVAVNAGLRASTAPVVVTLNSDTVVADGWLDGLLRCLASDPLIGIAGPLSNAASWQNVPDLLGADGTFAINALPPGLGPAEMAALVARASVRAYPRTPFLNGFCYAIRREVIDAVGLMDEAAFPTGYGEENDFSIRAQDAGFALAIADDTYVFHAKSRSFGTERRLALSEAGSAALRAKHPPGRLAELMARVRDTQAMDAVRTRVARALADAAPRAEARPARTARDWAFRQRVLFVLPTGPGGGGVHSIVQEAAAMRRMGVEARVAILPEHLDRYRRAYGDVRELDDLLLVAAPGELVMAASRFDAAVATIFRSARDVARIHAACPWVLPAYYAQDYEPLFFPEGSAEWREAHASYALVPGAVVFAKTDWIRREVERRHGVPVQKVMASIDHEVYRPSGLARPEGVVRLAAMIRPQTPRRGARRTMELLGRLKALHGEALAIRVFGCEEDRPEFQALPRDFAFEGRGVLRRAEVADLLRDSDVFVDLSDYQAFGRTALEAMACGAVAVVPRAGGADEFAVDGVNAVVVDTLDPEAPFDRLQDLLADPGRVAAMQVQAVATAGAYSPRRAALTELLALAPALARLRAEVRPPVRPRVTLVPALTAERAGVRSITGSGHVRVVQAYAQDALAGRFDVTVSRAGALPPPGTADLVLLQRDLVPEALPAFEPWLAPFRAGGGRLVYEIDDDLLDAEGLRARGFGGDAEALALRVRRYAEAADLITVSTPPLAGLFPDLAHKVRVVPNRLDARLWDVDGPMDRAPTAGRPKPEGVVRIGYMGTPSHRGDLRMVQEAVERVQARHGAAVDVEVIGAFHGIEPPFGRSFHLPRDHAYPNFARWLQLVADWDVAIIPVAEDRFNLAKSNLKLLEMAALGTAIACSDLGEYRAVARDGVNCLLVPNATEAWAAALSRLVEDAPLRRRLAEAAYRDVARRLTVQNDAALYREALEAALEGAA